MSRPKNINTEIVQGMIVASVEDPLIIKNTLFICQWTCPICNKEMRSSVYLHIHLQLRRCRNCDECYPIDLSEFSIKSD